MSAEDRPASVSFLLDENIPYSLIAYLEKKGYTAYHVRKLGKVGIRNGEVYELAVSLSAWIVTRDKDFRNLVKFLTYDVPGIIVIESEIELTRKQIVQVFDRFLARFKDLHSEKRLILIEDEEVRVLSAE
jgi:predicted nuclease of predicted toxin-antitoxin system